jgi:hypothetical protein
MPDQPPGEIELQRQYYRETAQKYNDLHLNLHFPRKHHIKPPV